MTGTQQCSTDLSHGWIGVYNTCTQCTKYRKCGEREKTKAIVVISVVFGGPLTFKKPQGRAWHTTKTVCRFTKLLHWAPESSPLLSLLFSMKYIRQRWASLLFFLTLYHFLHFSKKVPYTLRYCAIFGSINHYRWLFLPTCCTPPCTPASGQNKPSPFGLYPNHRRRIYTEENANVVVAVWGTE